MTEKKKKIIIISKNIIHVVDVVNNNFTCGVSVCARCIYSNDSISLVGRLPHFSIFIIKKKKYHAHAMHYYTKKHLYVRFYYPVLNNIHFRVFCSIIM